MASAFIHARLKRWIWIVIIVAGATVLLCLLILAWWCCARRKRAKRKSMPSPVLAPTRKVTIRRGRMVPSSRHLSLTGSKFGLGQFVNMEEKDQAESYRSQSRSPFTWWLSTMPDRSQSRQSHVSSQRPMDEVSSLYHYQKPEPAFSDRHTRNESGTSAYSLPSIINGRELAEDARLNSPLNSPLARTSSSGPHSPRYVNFSRAFSPLHHSSLRSNSAPNVLSQIVELSPRHSTASKHRSTISASEVASTRHSTTNAREAVEEDVVVSMPSPALAPHALQPSRSAPDHLLQSSPGGSNVTSRFSFTTETSLSLSTLDASRTPSAPPSSYLPATPRSGPFPWARMHREDSTPTPTPTLVAPVPEKQAWREKIEALDHGSAQTQSMAYWKSRPDLQPVRKPSKKGNVLRKKSIRRAEIVSWVGH